MTIQYICHKYHQPEPEPDPSKGKARQTKRSSSEPPAFPTNWATDHSQFRRAVKTFADRTTVYRSLVQLQSHFRKNELPGTDTLAEASQSSTNSANSASRDATANQSPAVNIKDPVSDTTRHTSASAEEAIYDRPIGPDLPFTMDEAALQRMINTAVQAAMAAQNQRGQTPGPTPPNGSSAAAEATPRQPQFRPRDVGYFDPDPQAAPVEAKDTHNIYHNVFSFTNRLRVKATTMDNTLLRQNIESCLLGAADDWYTNQLTHLSRMGLRDSVNGVKLWCEALEGRFRDSPGKSLALLENIRYTVRDARNRKDPADYVSSIVLNGKNAGIASTESAQVLLAYEHIDGQLRRDLPRPTDGSTIASLLEELRFQKDIWFDIYSQGGQPTRQDNKGRQPQGQYTNAPRNVQNNPFRPSGNGQTYGGPYRLYSAGADPYYGSRPPFVPYGNNNYGSNNNNQQQSSSQPPRQQQLGAPRQPLQITSGNANASPSGNRQPNQPNQPNRGNNFGKNPFRPYNNGFQRRAYQHDVDSNDDKRQPDDQEEYEEFEDSYYQGAQWMHEHQEPCSDHEVVPHEGDNEQNDTVETHFVNSSKPLPKCRCCEAAFSSNNLLHKHIRKRNTRSLLRLPLPRHHLMMAGIRQTGSSNQLPPTRPPKAMPFEDIGTRLPLLPLHKRAADTNCALTLVAP